MKWLLCVGSGVSSRADPGRAWFQSSDLLEPLPLEMPEFRASWVRRAAAAGVCRAMKAGRRARPLVRFANAPDRGSRCHRFEGSRHYVVMSLEPQSLSDTDLVRLSVHDPEAFETLFERHAVRMRGWLARQVGETSAANDLLAETFAQAWCARRRFAGTRPDEGAAWLYGIARNLARQHHRRGRVEGTARRRLGIATRAMDDGESEVTVGRIDAHALGGRLWAAMQSLPVAQRRAIDARVLRELDYDEVASELECTEVSARAYVSRGLRRLNTAMKGARA